MAAGLVKTVARWRQMGKLRRGPGEGGKDMATKKKIQAENEVAAGKPATGNSGIENPGSGAATEEAKPVPQRLTEAASGPTRMVTMSLNRWRLALKRLEGEISSAFYDADRGSQGIMLDQRPAGSMLDTIRRRIAEYHEALVLHRSLLAFQWHLRIRIAGKNQELGVNALLCEQTVTKKRVELLEKQVVAKRNEFRVAIEEIPELFQGVVEGHREILRAGKPRTEKDQDELLNQVFFNSHEVRENWKSRDAANYLTVETLSRGEREGLTEEFRALSRRLVAIGDEIADCNAARLTLEVPVEVADAIQI